MDPVRDTLWFNRLIALQSTCLLVNDLLYLVGIDGVPVTIALGKHVVLFTSGHVIFFHPEASLFVYILRDVSHGGP
jgi:hypothetical protein